MTALILTVLLCPAASPADIYREVEAVRRSGGDFVARCRAITPAEAAAIKAAADKGDADALFLHALRIDSGAEGKSAPADTFARLEKASKAGSAAATALVGMCYLRGIGTEKNPAAGVAALKKAMDGGDGFAAIALAEHERLAAKPDTAAIRKLFRTASEKGWAQGDLQLGVMARDGIGGKPDLAAAEKHFRDAHKGRHPEALLALIGVLRQRGPAGNAEADRIRADFLNAALKASGRANFFAGEWSGEFTEDGKKQQLNFKFADDGTPYWNMKIKLDKPGIEVYRGPGNNPVKTVRAIDKKSHEVRFTVGCYYEVTGATRPEVWVFQPLISDPTKLYIEKWFKEKLIFSGELTRTKN